MDQHDISFDDYLKSVGVTDSRKRVRYGAILADMLKKVAPDTLATTLDEQVMRRVVGEGENARSSRLATFCHFRTYSKGPQIDDIVLRLYRPDDEYRASRYFSSTKLKMLASSFAEQATWEGLRNAAFVFVAYETGLEASPLHSLLWKAVNLEEATREATAKGAITIGEKAVYPLTLDAISALMAYKDVFAYGYELFAPLKGELVWINSDGKKANDSTMRKTLARKSEIVDIKNLNLNDFRISYAANYLMQHPDDFWGLSLRLGVPKTTLRKRRVGYRVGYIRATCKR